MQRKIFTGANAFWVVQNSKSVINAINKPNKLRTTNSISVLVFSTLRTQLSHKQHLIVLDNMINFCFYGGRNKYITDSKYGAC